MITKTFVVVNAQTGEERQVRAGQGATAADILRHIGLPMHELARMKTRRPFQPNCDVSRVVGDRERLLAFAPIKFGGD